MELPVGINSARIDSIIRCSDFYTVSGAILSLVLWHQLQSRFDESLIRRLSSSAFALEDLNLSEGEKEAIIGAYMKGLHAVFIIFTTLTGIQTFSCLHIVDYGLKQRQ